ncbi:MAG: repeat-associated core protein [Phenylobacterium sp.]|nr:repeat-associated core protein [Phenylobacterium sp.]
MFDDDEDGFWAARFGMSPQGMDDLRRKAEARARQAYDATTRQIAQAGEGARRMVSDAEQGIDRFKAGVQSQMDQLMGQRAAEAKPKAPDLPLRGMLPAPPAPRAAPAPIQPQPGGYYADLSQPSQIPFMTTYAPGDPTHSYIDPHPAANLGRRISFDQLRDGVHSLAAGQPVDPGPTISFVNNVRGGPSTYHPLTTDTARMIAAGFLQSGSNSMNVSSTTGGQHVHDDRHDSLHYHQRAIDIDHVNGSPVSPTNPNRALQDIYSAQANIAEDFGPSYLLDNKVGQHALFRRPALSATHSGHLHIAGRK